MSLDICLSTAKFQLGMQLARDAVNQFAHDQEYQDILRLIVPESEEDRKTVDELCRSTANAMDQSPMDVALAIRDVFLRER